jgi:hypothetical protein
MTTAITLKDITIHPVVEQQGAFFDVMEFFPMLTKERQAGGSGPLLRSAAQWSAPLRIQ